MCIDSCHWYASGVDVVNAVALDEALGDLDRRIGLDRLRCLHVNDSAAPLDSNRDRHAALGEGLLGDGLATFLVPHSRGCPRSSRPGTREERRRRSTSSAYGSFTAGDAPRRARPSAADVVEDREDA